jgi:hypothetical protein
MFPSCRRLSPLFYQGGQFFIVPAPISCLGDGSISQLIVFPEGPGQAPMLAATVLKKLGLLVRTVLRLSLAVQSA